LCDADREVLGFRINGFIGAGAPGQRELLLVHIHGEDSRALVVGGRDRAESHSSAAKNENGVRGLYAAACSRVVADGERLYEAEFADGESWSGKELAPGHRNEFGECSVALDAQSLVELTGIEALAAAGGALSAA